MTTIKTLPWGINPCKIVDEKIILDECCFDETKHPYFNNNTEDVNKPCLIDTMGLDVEFIYSIECNSCKDRGPHSEVGIGKLVKENDKLTLDRSKVLYIQNSQLGRLRYEYDDLNPAYFDNNSPLVVSAHTSSPLDNLFEDTLYYDGGFVKLTEEGILFSSDGHITKLRPQDLVKFISKSSATISTGPISIKPLKTRPSRTKKGTIIFNEIKSKLEVYDGTEWKTLKWEE